MLDAKYTVKAFKAGVVVKQKQANSLKEALKLQERFQNDFGRVEIYERFYDEAGHIGYRPRVQIF